MQNGIWRAQYEIHGVVIDLDDLGVRGNVGLKIRAFGANAVGGKNHVVGGEGVAVLELDALAQMEAPVGGIFLDFPAFGQRGNDLEILVARDQAFIDISEMPMGGALVERIGIERFQFTLVGVAHGLRRCRHHRPGDGGTGRCKQTLTY